MPSRKFRAILVRGPGLKFTCWSNGPKEAPFKQPGVPFLDPSQGKRKEQHRRTCLNHPPARQSSLLLATTNWPWSAIRRGKRSASQRTLADTRGGCIHHHPTRGKGRGKPASQPEASQPTSSQPTYPWHAFSALNAVGREVNGERKASRAKTRANERNCVLVPPL
jgi:hypothetical protein